MAHRHERGPVVVLGAGIQGCCVALALASRGRRVLLLERRDTPFAGASHGNEGKIHLGFVYALDPSGATGRRMLRGALSFAPLLDRWCGPLPWADWRTEPFVYAVMPDSMASADALERAYASLREAVPAVLGSLSFPVHYLGAELEWFVRRGRGTRGYPRFDGRPVEGRFDTQEVSVDTRALGSAVTRRLLQHPLIDVRCSHRVEGVERTSNGFRIEVTADGRVAHTHGDVVVNCTWEDRDRLDRTVGLPGDNSLCYRIKHRAIVRPKGSIADLAPVTMVQGPYGDVVPLRDGSVYVSWYPVCRTYFSDRPPAHDPHEDAAAPDIARRSLDVLGRMFPSIRDADILSASGCIIVASGRSDVEDHASGLHERHRIGSVQHDGWWSVDTGKLTVAPLNAEHVAAQVCGEGLDVLA